MYRWVLLFAISLLWTPISSAQITEEVSDITGEYRVASDDMNDLWIDTYAGDYGAYMPRYVSNPSLDRERWMIIFYGFTDEETSMSDADNVYITIDGQQIQPLDVTMRTRVLDDEIMEVAETVYSQSIFTRMANAEEVQVDIGDETFELPDREEMRMILQTVNNQGEQTASSDDD
ncbi:MAG: hypothetical protein R6U20_05735 [Longimonas sp.]|uniref:hypothetical protein n=1 Tax=Longimonas sp. TaxID=2039626 RepID=UPI0039749285